MPRCDLGNYFKISWCELLSDTFVLDSVSFSSFCAFLRRAECLRELSCLFKGCWRISTSQTMQTNYASSPGKAKPLLWTSLKPSHQWLSWGGWHCRYFWRRMAGNCMWEPGCTGHCWAGFGWTLFLNEQGRKLPRWETHKRHGETVPFSCIRSTQGVFQMQSSIWLEAQRFIPHVWLTDDLELKGEQRYFKLFVLLIPSRYLDLQPETMTKHLGLLSIGSLKKYPLISTMNKNIYSICFSWNISPFIRFSQD